MPAQLPHMKQGFKHLLGHVVGKPFLRRKSKFRKILFGEQIEMDGAPGGRRYVSKCSTLVRKKHTNMNHPPHPRPNSAEWAKETRGPCVC